MLQLEKNELETQLGHCFREKQFAQDKSGKSLVIGFILTSNLVLINIQLKEVLECIAVAVIFLPILIF